MKKNFILFCILFNFVTQNVSAKEYDYDVYGLNFRFMKIKFSNINNSEFRTDIESKSFLNFFYYFKGVGITQNQPRGATYNFAYEKKDKQRSTTVIFKDLKVIQNFSKPERKKKSNIVSVAKKDLENVVDPLSAIQQLIFEQSNKLNCNKQQKVFDGSNVFYLQLSQPGKDDYVINSSKLIYKKPMQKCRLTYKAVSGHEVEDEEKLNKKYVDIFYGKLNKIFFPYFLTTKSTVTLEMFLK